MTLDNVRAISCTVQGSPPPSTTCYGIFNNDSNMVVKNSEVNACFSSATNCYGMFSTNNSIVSVSSSSISGSSPTATLSYGIYEVDNLSRTLVRSSVVSGNTDSFRFGGSTLTRIIDTLIDSVDNDPAGAQCRETYNSNLTDVSC